MKGKRVSVVFIAAAFCLLFHCTVLWNFSKHQPRLEILFNEAVPQAASMALKAYHPQEEGTMLVIKGDGKRTFLAKEIADILHQHGIEQCAVNDRTQALRIAKQSMGIYAFALEIIVFIWLLNWLLKDCKKQRALYKAALVDAYPRDIFSSNLDRFLLTAIKWVIVLAVLTILAIQLLDFEFYVPAQFVPPNYILDFKYYLSLHIPAISHTAYEYLCARSLPLLYKLCFLNIGFALWIAVILWKRLGKHEHTRGI